MACLKKLESFFKFSNVVFFIILVSGLKTMWDGPSQWWDGSTQWWDGLGTVLHNGGTVMGQCGTVESIEFSQNSRN